MSAIEYHPIGIVECAITEPLRPEIIRALESRLVLEPRFAPAVAALEVGQHLLVVYHLHRAVQWQDCYLKELFTRRIACRPNPIGVTLTRIVALSGSTITVVGLDAINGTPILDIKPYKPIFDVPPVHPTERKLKTKRYRGITTLFRKRKNLPTSIPDKYNRPVIVLTGGPGGGKSTLQTELANDPEWAGRFVALPEAVQYARFVNISPGEKLFQRVIVNLQMSLEDGLARALDTTDPRPIICHRGSLDPLAFWLQRGWSEEEFFEFTETSREEHYRRYTAVIHLVTAADGAPQQYTRWPEAHRPEAADEAIRLDRWLQQTWSGHPKYFRIDNEERDWPAKSKEARKILSKFLDF